jgi:hypothetical protein
MNEIRMDFRFSADRKRDPGGETFTGGVNATAEERGATERICEQNQTHARPEQKEIDLTKTERRGARIKLRSRIKSAGNGTRMSNTRKNHPAMD